MPAKDFQDLIMPACAWHADRWQKAHQFVLSMYLFSNNFPKNEIYGLTSQTGRAVISIPANIAETYTASILDSGS
jgi:four helix bundle protein